MDETTEIRPANAAELETANAAIDAVRRLTLDQLRTDPAGADIGTALLAGKATVAVVFEFPLLEITGRLYWPDALGKKGKEIFRLVATPPRDGH